MLCLCDRHERATGTMRTATEERNGLAVLIGDADFVDAAALGPPELACLSGQRVVHVRGSQKIDGRGRCHRDGIVGIASDGECAVGEREDQTAMAHAMSVDHVRPHRHAKPCEPRPDLFDPDAEASRCVVLGEERLRGELREPLRVRFRRARAHGLRRSSTRFALPMDRSRVPGWCTYTPTLMPISDFTWYASSRAARPRESSSAKSPPHSTCTVKLSR